MSIAELVQDALEQSRPIIQQYGLLAVFVGILAETLLFAGLFLPGFSILMAAGFLAAEGQLSPWLTLGAALGGGFIGDQTAYTLGRLMGDRLLRRHEKALVKLRYALRAEGASILLWYHYVSPLRIVMPYIAGSLGYPRPRWLLFDTIGLALWIGFAFGLGYLAHGPLTALGDVGYYIVFGAVLAMVLFTVWRLARLLLRRESPLELMGEELDRAGEIVEWEEQRRHIAPPDEAAAAEVDEDGKPAEPPVAER